MATQTDHDEPVAILNVVQVIALNIVCFVALGFAAKALGLSWGIAIGVAWVGGCVLTLCIAVAVCWYQTVRQSAQAAPPEADVPARESDNDPMINWYIDSLLEENHMILTRQGTTLPVSDVKALRMWLEDALDDRSSACLALGEAKSDQCGEPELPCVGQERRRQM